ncbi:MAG TPA: potassium transporter TrkG [Acidimicrobiia bacterium]|nr:potassium transporter TrkG [Acidimicrobiia bacterium]
MLLRPHREDVAAILYYQGRVMWLMAAAGLIPATVAMLASEWRPLGWFLTMSGVAALGGAATDRLRPASQLRWGNGMVVVALTWLLVPAVSAIPFALSGHFRNVLDALFEAMSGFTATGLSVMADLDHSPVSLTVWRQTTQFLGGQGIVLAALTLFAGGGILALYQGEGRDERIFPSVRSTSRFIWLVAAWHGLVGIGILWSLGVFHLGYSPGRALLHAFSIFVGAFDTGGFAPMSTSLAYYRSVAVELVTMWLMLAGAISFGVHYALWRGPRRVHRNLETRTLAGSLAATTALLLGGLVMTGAYGDVASLVRRGLFQVLSAHTSTGFATVGTSDLLAWGGLAFAAIATAMALGGMGSSTSGGVKALRVGLTLKILANTVREVLLPEHSVIGSSFYQNGRKELTDRLARSVMAISLLFVALYLFGALIGLFYGYPLDDALFESVSAAGTVGLSVGITQPGMPVGLETTYIFLMWAGRLEFIALFALVGFVVAAVRGR